MEMKYIQDTIARHQPNLVIRPQLNDFQLIDIMRGEEGIAEGERVMRQVLPDLVRIFMNYGLTELGQRLREQLGTTTKVGELF